MRVSSRGRGVCVEPGDDVVGVEGPVRPALDVTPARHPSPRQQVGVMLDHGGEHHVVGVEAQAVGELVEGFGGVPAQDGDVAVAAGSSAGEGEGGGPGRLVGRGGQPGLVPRPAVHARVHGDELLDGSHDRWECAGRGGGVEVHVAALGAVDARDDAGRRPPTRRQAGPTSAARPKSTGHRSRPLEHRPVPSPGWNTTSTVRISKVPISTVCDLEGAHFDGSERRDPYRGSSSPSPTA